MSEMKKITYKEAEARVMVGMHSKTSFSEAGQVWQEYFKSGTMEKLETISGLTDCGDIDANAGIGMMYHFEDQEHFELMIGD